MYIHSKITAARVLISICRCACRSTFRSITSSRATARLVHHRWRKSSRVSSRVHGFFSTDVSKAKSAIVFRVNGLAKMCPSYIPSHWVQVGSDWSTVGPMRVLSPFSFFRAGFHALLRWKPASLFMFLFSSLISTASLTTRSQ